MTLPFLRWVGSKSKLVETLAQYVPENIQVYSEPFLGGGSLFFHLRSLGRLDGCALYLSDVNKYLIGAYRAVQKDPEAVVSDVTGLLHEHSEDVYYRRRDEWNAFRGIEDAAPFCAALFIYLNLTNYNGLYRVNKKKGDYNVPLGRNKVNFDPLKIRAASAALRGVELVSGSYETPLELVRLSSLAKLKCFTYCDPPYLPGETSKFTSYDSSGFDAESHQTLAARLATATDFGVHVLASNSLAARELYSGPPWVTEEVSTAYTVSRNASSRGAVKELLIRSSNLERRVS